MHPSAPSVADARGPPAIRRCSSSARLLGACAGAGAGAGGLAAQGGGDPWRWRPRASTTPLFDGHNDLPWAIRGLRRAAPRDVAAYDLRSPTPGHTDIARLREGKVGAQFWSVYIPAGSVAEGAAKTQLEQIDIAQQVFARYPDVFEETLTPEAAVDAFERGKIASVMGMEGGHAIENSLGALRSFYDLGARYMTLTHSANIDWADSCCEAPEHGGLSRFGEEVVREMNRLGMLVDLSHVSPETMHDALDVAEAPVIFSHSSARGVADHPRNVPDDVLRRLRENGGVVMVTFVPGFIDPEIVRLRVAPRRAAAARRRLPPPHRRRGGPHRARARRGGDRPRGHRGRLRRDQHAPRWGWRTSPTYPALFAELARRGWSEADLRKLAGENVLRVVARGGAHLRASPAGARALDGDHRAAGRRAEPVGRGASRSGAGRRSAPDLGGSGDALPGGGVAWYTKSNHTKRYRWLHSCSFFREPSPGEGARSGPRAVPRPRPDRPDRTRRRT